ncbi:MAG: zf-HC2 domain-containing protein [Acidobacteriota bacterium]
MQCREVRDLLDSFLGQELLVETNHELLRHVEGCPDCRAELEARRQLRAALQQAFTRAESLQPRAGFSTEVLSRVRSGNTHRSRWASLWTWGALAASLVLLTATGLFLLRNGVTALGRDAVGDHLYCAVKFRLAERPIALTDPSLRDDPTFAKLQDTPQADIATAAGPVRVLERHACVFAGRRFAHVVLQFEGQLVSLLVTADPGATTSGRAASVSWFTGVDGQRVAGFKTTGHAAFVVSAVPERQFRVIAQALADPVSHRLTLGRRNPLALAD